MKKVVLMLLALTMALTCVSAFADDEDIQYGIWELRAYVDEFDMPTDEYFIVATADKAKFSNSVTTDSELDAFLFCEELNEEQDYIEIRLYEYGDYRVKNPYSEAEEYNIIMMDDDKNKYQLNGVMFSGYEDIVIFDEEDVRVVKEALKKGGTVRFAVTEEDDPLTKYIFSFDEAAGFDKAYAAWKK